MMRSAETYGVRCPLRTGRLFVLSPVFLRCTANGTKWVTVLCEPTATASKRSALA
jgi:hypothetical protein